MLVKHSGNVGDICNALPAIEAFSALDTVDLLLTTGASQHFSEPHPLGNVRLTPEWAESLAPLLRAQSYINSVEVLPQEVLKGKRFAGCPIMDLDNFRLLGLSYDEGPCQRWFLWLTGLHADLSQACLTVEPSAELKDCWVVSRTSRNHNRTIDRRGLTGLPLVFVGLPEEYAAFRQELPNVPYRPVKDWLELAQLLAGSKGLIANQGGIFALAECLKVPRLLETPLSHANVYPQGGVCYEARNQAQWDGALERLTGKGRTADYEVRRKVPEVFIHAQDDTACTLYRALAPGHFGAQLLKNRIGFHIGPLIPGENAYGAVCLQRVVRGTFLRQVMRMKGQGKRFVWDTDDDFFALPPSNPAFTEVDNAIKETLEETMRLADFITCTTPELARAIGHPDKTRVLPNLIDPNLWPQPKREERPFVRILWAGSFSHDADLIFLEQVHALVRERMGDRVQWTFAGYWPSWACVPKRTPGEPVFRLAPKFKDVGLVQGTHLSAYPWTMCDLAPDIALCPLQDIPFNHRKSGVKAWEMALAGAAVIAADLSPYSWLEDGEDGMLCTPDDAEEWADAICMLVKSRKERESLNAELVKRTWRDFSWYNHEARKPWLDFWQDLVA